MNRIDNDELNTASSKNSRLATGLLLVAFLLLLVALVLFKQSPPAAVAADAPANVFSSARAMKHLQAIAQGPRPIGSAGHTAARDYILNELTAIGLQPEVQETTVLTTRADASVVAAVVHNVMARLKGTTANKALMLAGHYDSVPNAPGTSDDGASVATMLETIRALKTGPPLNNDVIFLFTDGEELGLLGAKGFVNEHPWAKDVGLALNFEARGTAGPVVMFETSDGNDWLVREFARAAPSPLANSLLYEIYKLLPNDTDLTEFRAGRIPGLNFAFIEQPLRYHTQADNIENLDQRSLQHQGSYALALAQHFGNLNLDQPRNGQNAIYFDVFGTTLFHYSARWVLPLSILILIVFLAVLALGLKKRKLTITGIIAGFLLFLLNLTVASVVVYLLWSLIVTIQVRMGRSLADDFYRDKLYFLGFVLLALAITATLYHLFRRKVRTENLFAGALLCWVILLLLTSFFMPGGSYALAWPLLTSLLGLAYTFTAKEGKPRPLLNLVVLLLCAAPGIVLLVPIIYTAFIALGLSEVALLIPVVILLSGLVIPHCAFATSSMKWLPIGPFVIAAVCIAAAAFNSGFSRQYPKSDHVFYVLNADTGKTAWASADDSTDEWTTQFFPSNTAKTSLKDYIPLSVNNYRINSAPAVPLSAADIRVTSDSSDGDVRILRLRVITSNDGISIAIPRDANVEVVRAEVNGKPVDEMRSARAQSPSSWSLQFWAPPKQGFDLVLGLRGAKPAPLKTVNQSYGLPEIPGTTIRPRPDYIVPSTFPNSNFSLVTKSYDF
ncbi:MAG TPA: M28 family metallopeptidase [Pyrinomonadaceae bacterium]|nr:M28 family metallopeptidase [Pyrinomonadaceae bacterium]